ncbi:MAG: hypothetical protein ACE5HF_09455 [Gemmatimonadota bacterium]
MPRPSHSRTLPLALAALFLPSLAAAQESVTRAPDLPARSDLVRVEHDSAAHVVDVVLGPFQLMAGMPHLRAPIQLAHMPVDGWLHAFEAVIEDADGNALPSELLHHVNFIDPDHRELFSPIARRVIAAGRETHKQELPRLLGIPLTSSDRMLISAMFANPTGQDYPEAYLHVRLSYSREDEGIIAPRDVYPFYLDVMGPLGVKDFPVPPGRTEMAWEGSPAIEGRILGIGGHLHDYATELRFEDATEDRVLWRAEPEHDETGRVVGVPTGKLWWRGGVKIHPDHRYRIVVVYDNPMDRAAPDGGMGAIGGVLWAAKGVEWPTFDRANPDYVADLRATLTAPERLKGHGHGEHGMPGMDMEKKPEGGAPGSHTHGDRSGR